VASSSAVGGAHTCTKQCTGERRDQGAAPDRKPVPQQRRRIPRRSCCGATVLWRDTSGRSRRALQTGAPSQRNLVPSRTRINATGAAHLGPGVRPIGTEVDYARFVIRKRDLKPPIDAVLSEHWPWPVRITTFGGITLRVDDEPAQWARKAQYKPIDLLRALVAYGGRQVPSNKLTDDLWPDAEGDAAANALKTTPHRLRKIRGREDAAQLRDGQLSLNPACVWVNRWALEQVLEEVGAASSRTPSAQPLDALERTSQRLLDLYKGRLLEKSDLPCAAAPREAPHRKYLLAVERLGAAFASLAMQEKARRVYGRALDVDPAAEWLYSKPMPFSRDT
jgi:hypothetical protein